MKRGKDEEKIMGPMFPRLHVNDTEKGGPRAPPRNKMALYEQLSIPSQRFNQGVLPPNPNNTTNLVPPASSSQANGRERSMFVPLQRAPSTNPAEKPYTRYADLNAPLMQLEQQNNREEDDFQVPIFDHNRVNFASNQSPRENIEGPLKQSNAPSSYGVANESTRSLDYRNSSVPIRNLQEEEQRNLTDNNGDDLSETSMVDSISAVDISPDDVVGIIGQKHFWKARRAIVNQQRVFAVQVFELHRLMKVQRLIAASPHLLLEDNAYLGKPPKASPAKKLPLEYIVKATPNIEKPKLVSEKSNRTSECSAENAVAEKASLSSVQNGSKHPNYSDPSPTGVTSDTKMGSWGFNQPPGHQWLIPVMTPSEGLVYKPYPGPGFSGPACGGCGPPGSTPPPTMGNFLYYGLPPPPHHYQGLGVPHFAPPGSHGYFPPYGMPVMNPSDLVPSGPDFNMQYQSSCNAPTQKNGADSGAMNTHNSKDGELQASTASSPSVRGQRTRVGPTAEDKNPLSLFPTGPVPDGVPPPHDTDLPTRVIRVVPHNARSATESAARIFQSIQEERKQYDSG